MPEVPTPEITLPDLCIAYRGVRERIGGLIRAATPDAIERIAPATPLWRVHDVLAHVVGVTTDILAGRLDGVASDAWTDAQVAVRRNTPAGDLLAEWERTLRRSNP